MSAEATAYAIPRTVQGAFDDVVERTRAALAEQGFGILTVIDVRATMQEKLGEEMDEYVILGACNPGLAHRGLAVEPDLGVLLPCNVVVRRVGDDEIRVAAMEPQAALALAGNEAIRPLADEARERLTRAMEVL
jgi:uncharacterized protein (DUF302 family)